MTTAIKLNEKDRDLLQRIFEYGGYATSVSLCSYRNDISGVAVFYILKKLTDGGYLKAIPFYSDSRRNVTVYQVTARTCKLFDNPDSYYRKKHEDTYIIRALIKGHFLFEISKDLGPAIIAEHERKLQLLNDELKISSELLPRKYNKGTPLIHVEEVLLDMRKVQNKQLFCKASMKICSSSQMAGGFMVVHTDKPSANAAAQLITLMERYRQIMELNLITIDFLIVTDSKKREDSYRKAIDWMINSSSFTQQRLIQLHLKILQESLEMENRKVKDLPEKIKVKYSEAKEIIAEDLSGIPIEDIQEKGMEAVEGLTHEILSGNCDKEVKLAHITELFRKLYRLAAAGGFKIALPYDIFIYRIGYKYSVN